MQDAKHPLESDEAEDSETEEDGGPGLYIHWDDAAVAEFVRVANNTPGLPPHQFMLATGPGLMTLATFKEEVRWPCFNTVEWDFQRQLIFVGTSLLVCLMQQ